MREVIIACDFKNRTELDNLLEKLKDERPYLKIGMEMYYRYGYELVKELKEKGYKIFLDLKLHDIPNTVASAARVVAELKTDVINVHASGGIEMMRRAAEEVRKVSPETKIIAVTQLTSTSSEMLRDELLIETPMTETVRHYAENAKKAGLDGIVCSALEAPEAVKLGLMSVTPGIRFAGGSVDDQKRVVTPEKAKELGSSYIVMGRAITGAEDVLAAYKRAVKEFCE
jgi:orotidine-5'-phosphate decarboxylase